MPIDQARLILLAAFVDNPDLPDDMKAKLAKLIVPQPKRKRFVVF